MRVVRLITRLNIGGPSIQAIALTESLTRFGYETLLVHGSLGAGEGDMRYLLKRDTPVEGIPPLVRRVAPFEDARALARIVAVLRRTRPAILHTHMAKAGTLGRLAAIAYNRMPGHPPLRVVHTYHGHVLDGYFSAPATRAVIGVERALAHATDRIVAISEQISHELNDTYRIGRPAQYRVIPLGFDLDPFAAIDAGQRVQARAALDLDPSAPVVTTVGRLTAIKQHDLFLRAAAKIAAARNDAVFLVVGDGELRESLETDARTLGIASRTRFLGWRRDLSAVYAASDVFVLTSRNEGTPVALIEAMASAVPGVATDVGGVADVIRSNEVGVRVPAGDAESIAAGVDRLLGDAPLRQSMGNAARQTVLARFRLERLVTDIAALYEELRRSP